MDDLQPFLARRDGILREASMEMFELIRDALGAGIQVRIDATSQDQHRSAVALFEASFASFPAKLKLVGSVVDGVPYGTLRIRFDDLVLLPPAR
jgi:hypothetical protein